MEATEKIAYKGFRHSGIGGLNQLLKSKGIKCDLCGKEKRMVISKLNDKGKLIRVCLNCNKKEKEKDG